MPDRNPLNSGRNVRLSPIFAYVPVVKEVSLLVVIITSETGYTEVLLSCSEVLVQSLFG